MKYQLSKKIVITTLFSFCVITVVCNVARAEGVAHQELTHHQENETHRAHESHDHEKVASPHVENRHEAHKEHGDEKAHGHSGESHGKNSEHGKGITLNAQNMAIASITVETLMPKMQFSSAYAPGEVKVNGYKSYVVSPRTESVVISRHATLGEHVEIGQKLVTLFSESMVQAQADYLIASTEWQRVKKLGNKGVSESSLLQAETEFSAAYGKLLALGLTYKAIKNISNKDIALFGQYSLVAEREGVVLQDNFLQGQRMNAGDTIMLLANERELWVEAKVSPNKKLHLAVNSPAIVQFNNQNYSARVIQEAHTIDPITRTRIVRLSVQNTNHELHSGMFVNVNFQFPTQNKVIAVPEEALMRSADGDWVVFVEEHPGEFEPVEVELGRSFGENREIIGLESGSRVVTKGAFFVASEIAKGGFDPHNH